jgi:hypothetical protein
VLNGEATNINFIVFGLTRSGLEPKIYHSRGEHASISIMWRLTIINNLHETSLFERGKFSESITQIIDTSTYYLKVFHDQHLFNTIGSCNRCEIPVFLLLLSIIL